MSFNPSLKILVIMMLKKFWSGNHEYENISPWNDTILQKQ